MSDQMGGYYRFSSNQDFFDKYKVDMLPDECPACHCGIESRVAMVYEYDNNCIYVVCICPKLDCKELFIASYEYDYSTLNGSYFFNGDLVPYIHKNIEFGDKVKSLSDNFIEIYNQAYQAEKSKLSQICGPGYRKALEYLVKDYAILKNQNDKSEIERKELSKCIDDYIADTKIKQISKRAVWIGNDETHYVRKWEDKDINDLRILIKLTSIFIESELVAEDYLNSMQNGRR